MLTEAETHYRSLFDNVPLGLYHFTSDWRILDANPALVRMLGYPDRETLCSVRLSDIYADVETLKEWQAELEREGVLPAYEVQYRRRDGTLIWVENHGRTVEAPESGGVTYYEGTIQDITKRKAAEDALREQEKLYRLIVETANEGIWIIDTEGVIQFINDQAAEMLGYTVEEMLGRKAFDFLFREDQKEARRRFEARKQGHSEQAEFRARRRDGSEIQILTSSTPILDEGGKATGLLGMLIDITDLREAEAERARLAAEVASQRGRLREILANVPGIVWETVWDDGSPSRTANFVSDYVETMLGYSAEEWLSTPNFWLGVVHEEDRERTKVESAEIIASGERGSLDYRLIARDGRVVWVETQFVVIKEGGRPVGMRGVTIDITERKRLEEQFRQAQKMEAVGRLAAGVAHDFNNLMTVIGGYSDLSLRRLRPDDPLHRNLTEIKRAGDRAAVLTRQLLAFSRKQVLQPVVLNLNSLIRDMHRMLERMIGEDVELFTKMDAGLGQVKADPGQIEQVIVNLAVNARDAMPQGGKIIIETSNVMMDEAITRQYESVRPGPHVLLAVSDTGQGMSRETQSRVFEPFFTTKEVGKGTGLGLSTVYGIVKQSDGYISVYSEEGRGTTFRIYLPRVDEQAEAAQPASKAAELPEGSETILLVEDEDMVRGIAQATLEMSGYKVLTAANAGEALLLCERRDCQIDMLLTDVVMPQMSGRELAERLKDLRPEMKILFMSGYTEDAIRHHGVLEEGTEFIEKPFTPDALARKVRRVLDSPDSRSG